MPFSSEKDTGFHSISQPNDWSINVVNKDIFPNSVSGKLGDKFRYKLVTKDKRILEFEEHFISAENTKDGSKVLIFINNII